MTVPPPSDVPPPGAQPDGPDPTGGYWQQPPPYGQYPPPPPPYGQYPQFFPPTPYGHPAYGQPPHGQPPYGQPMDGQPPYAFGPPSARAYAQPGVMPLKPTGLDAGDYFEVVTTVFRRDWKTVLGVSLWINGLSLLLSLCIAVAGFVSIVPAIRDLDLPPDSVDWSSEQSSQFLRTVILPAIPFVLAYVVVLMITRSLLCAATSVIVSEDTVGRQISIGETMRAIRPVAGRVTVLGMVGGLLTVLGLCLCLVPGFVVFVFWSLGTPAMTLERRGVFTALSRSWDLVRGSFWKVFGIRAMFSLLVGVGSQTVLRVVNSGVPGTGSDASLSTFLIWASVYLVVQFAMSVVTSPIGPSALAALYVDMRIRKEWLLPALLAGRSPRDAGWSRN